MTIWGGLLGLAKNTAGKAALAEVVLDNALPSLAAPTIRRNALTDVEGVARVTAAARATGLARESGHASTFGTLIPDDVTVGRDDEGVARITAAARATGLARESGHISTFVTLVPDDVTVGRDGASKSKGGEGDRVTHFGGWLL